VNSRRITLIIAIVVAVAAGLLTVHYLQTITQNAQVPVIETRPTVVASRDIPAHQRIVPAMLTSVQRRVDQIEPGAFTDPKQAEGDVSLIAIPEGAPVTSTKIGVPAAIGITGKLQTGMRAVSILVDYVKSVSGLVEPGDRVDVLASAGRGLVTRAIIRGASVLAVNATLDPVPAQTAASGGSAAPPAPVAVTSVTLAVTPEQANALTYADLNTTLRLALRPPSEPVRSFPVEPLEIDATPSGPANNFVPPLRPQGANGRPSATSSPGVTVIEGSAFAPSSI
jgi:pilus assembly protein CpaB